MCTSDLCPPFGVYYGAQQGTEACINGACCAGGAPTCICITCDSDSDCPACSNGAVPRCENGRCKCKPCETNSDCISGYCCKYVIDNANRECVSEGTIYNYGGKSYLCDPPEWHGEQTESKARSILEIVWNFLVSMLRH